MTTHQRLKLTPEARRLPPRTLHKALMRGLAHVRLSPDGARADAAMTFSFLNDSVLDTYTRDGVDIILPWQTGESILHERLAVHPDPQRFRVRVARQYRPRVASDDEAVKLSGGVRPSGRLSPVPEELMHGWASRLLERAGISAEGLTAVVGDDLLIDGGHKFHNRVPTALLEGTAPGHQLASSIAAGGIGRAKNYGLGHILPASSFTA